MKGSFITLIFLTFSVVGFSQDKKNETQISNKEFKISFLSYAKQIPDTSTYSITKNTSGETLTKEVLEMINHHRSFESNKTWIVSDDIEILIYKAKKIKL